MTTRPLGTSNLLVSALGLGCMNFSWAYGQPTSKQDAIRVIHAAFERGVIFFDTAKIHGRFLTEETVGAALAAFCDQVVSATKREGPNSGGLSRKAILSEIDHSVKRLGMEYGDLYLIQCWDAQAQIAETMAAQHDVVKAGKARYIGASAMWTWQFQQALHGAETHRWTRFVSMQDHLNLISREEEREILPLCRARNWRGPVQPARIRTLDPRAVARQLGAC